MTPPISYAKTNLSLPLQCVDFDPYSRGYVVVAGGGGENRGGVPNKITVLDSTNLASLENVAELDLSRDEDTPVSLSTLATKDGLVVFAGINSSTSDRQAGKNEHLRSFEVKIPARGKKNKDEKTPTGSIRQLSKTCLFTPANVTGTNGKYAYQALTRLSPVGSREKPSKRIGALVSGLSGFGEIVLFDATTTSPSSALTRLNLGDGVEVHDLDVIEPYDTTFALALCTDRQVYTYSTSYDFGKKKAKSDQKEPTAVYSIPKAASGMGMAPPPRIRWISEHNLLLVRNRGPSAGAEIIVLHLVKAGEPAQVVLKTTLPASLKAAKGLDVCLLDSCPGTGERQIVVAVSGDTSIYVYTLNHQPQYLDPLKQFKPLQLHTTLENVHPQHMSRIALSNFFPPRQPADSPKSVATPSQYIQLASISLSGSVSVETLTLTSQPTSPSATAQVRSPQTAPNVRWVLSTRSQEVISSWAGRVLIAFVVLVSAIVLRSYLDIQRNESVIPDSLNNLGAILAPGHFATTSIDLYGRGAQPTPLASHHPVQDTTAGLADEIRAAVHDAESTFSPDAHKRHRLRDLLYNNQRSLEKAASRGSEPAKAVLVHLDDETDNHAKLAATEHDVEHAEALVEKGAQKYEDMHEDDKAKWRRRLVKAGHWTEAEGESVLLGILFSEYAGIVGGALRDAVLGGQ